MAAKRPQHQPAVIDVELYQEVPAPIADLEEDPDNIRLENNPDTVDGLSRALEHAGRYDVAPRVWETPDGKLRAIAGSGRIRAAKQAQRRNGDLRQIPVVRVAAPRDRAEKVLLQFAENALRDPLGPVDFGRGLRMLHAEGYTYDQILDQLKQRGIIPQNRTRPWVTQMIQLTELDSDVQRLVNRGDLSVWHALQLKSLAPGEQKAAAERIVAEALSRADVREMLSAQPDEISTEARLLEFRRDLERHAVDLAQAPRRRGQSSPEQRHGPVSSSWTLTPLKHRAPLTRSKVSALERLEWYRTQASPEERELAVEAVQGGHSIGAAIELVQRAVSEAPRASAELRDLLISLGRIHSGTEQLHSEAGSAPAEFARLRLRALLRALRG